MFLYNQRTSILKVLYYVENPWANNAGFWKIHLGNQRHQFFNHTGELALPMNINYVNNWITTNASCMEDLSFREGWNGFQIQLAYDTTNDATGSILNLVTANANITKKSMHGEFDGYSQGTLVTHGSTNPVSSLVNDIASVFGNEAQSYITNKFGKDDSTSTRSVIMGGIAGAVVKWGANKVLGAITAGFSKPTVRVSDISFTTRTKGTLSGQDTFDANAPSLTFAPNFSTTDLGCHLGAWNLAETPTVYVDPRADVLSGTGIGNERYYRLRGITGYKYKLAINPDLEKHIIKKWIVIEPVRYSSIPDSVLKNPIKDFDYGSLGVGDRIGFEDLSYNGQECIYKDGSMRIYKDEMKSAIYMRERLYSHYGKILRTIFAPKELEYSSGCHKYTMENRYLKFSLYLVTEFEGKRDTTLHTRTFAPKVEWDPVLYEEYKNYPFEIIP